MHSQLVDCRYMAADESFFSCLEQQDLVERFIDHIIVHMELQSNLLEQ